MQELLRSLPNCLLGCRLYQQWLSVADRTPDDAVPLMKRSQFIILDIHYYFVSYHSGFHLSINNR